MHKLLHFLLAARYIQVILLVVVVLFGHTLNEQHTLLVAMILVAIMAIFFSANLITKVFSKISQQSVRYAIVSGASWPCILKELFTKEAWPLLVSVISETARYTIAISLIVGLFNGNGLGKALLEYSVAQPQLTMFMLLLGVICLLFFTVQIVTHIIASKLEKSYGK